VSALPDVSGFERVVIASDPPSGLRAIIAIHSTALGPALGGTRFHPYADDDAALHDVLDLARAMTAKNALAGLPHGGGKGVIVGDPRTDKTRERLEAYGRLVASLAGAYVTACDVGTYVADMDVIATVNPWTTGRSPELGGCGDSGDLTSVGVHHSIKALARHLWGSDSLAGRRVGITGAGKVGGRLAGHVLAEGGRVLVADVDPAALVRLRAQHPDAEVASSADEVVEADLDVFSPCALGGAINPDVAERLTASAICGGANNQLATPGLDERLRERGIVYAPDVLVNAGGVVAVGQEWADRGRGYDDAVARERARGIGATLAAVLTAADRDGTTPLAAAERLARRRVEDAEPRPPFGGFPA
jgi:valine dehydrogenase (NAD+)